mmetsp:Transcript_14882/g.32843  ORF Transcript_14882/g.32843 Transcript_14882/m.32843 type:complete len:315 (-) Transcript_14882:2530-3474(-)
MDRHRYCQGGCAAYPRAGARVAHSGRSGCDRRAQGAPLGRGHRRNAAADARGEAQPPRLCQRVRGKRSQLDGRPIRIGCGSRLGRGCRGSRGPTRQCQKPRARVRARPSTGDGGAPAGEGPGLRGDSGALRAAELHRAHAHQCLHVAAPDDAAAARGPDTARSGRTAHVRDRLCGGAHTANGLRRRRRGRVQRRIRSIRHACGVPAIPKHMPDALPARAGYRDGCAVRELLRGGAAARTLGGVREVRRQDGSLRACTEAAPAALAAPVQPPAGPAQGDRGHPRDPRSAGREGGQGGRGGASDRGGGDEGREPED